MSDLLGSRRGEKEAQLRQGNGDGTGYARRRVATTVSGPRTVIACLLAFWWVVSLPFMLFILPWTTQLVRKKHGFRGVLWPLRDMPAQELALFIQERRTEFQLIGFLWALVAIGFLLTGAAFAVQIRKMESGEPIFTFIIVATAAVDCFCLMFNYAIWTAMSYRPSVDSPHTIQMFYDLFWTFFWISWPPFTVQMVAIAIPTLRAPVADATVPRWVAYLCLSTGGLSVLFGLAGIMPSGMFSYDGIGIATTLVLFAIENFLAPVGIAVHIYKTEIRRSAQNAP